MAKISIVYATTEGQTRRIAEHMAEIAEARGHEIDVLDASALPRDFSPASYAGIVVAGSVHMGRHQSSLDHFVRRHGPSLARLPNAFVSVSLSAAGDADDRGDALACARRFLAETGWDAKHTHIVAGAFRFSRYDFFKRWIMRRIAREKGHAEDADRDVEYTDWDDLEHFVTQFLAEVDAGQASPESSRT